MNHLPTIAKHSSTIAVSPNEEIEAANFVEKPYDQFVPALLASYAAVGGLNNRDAHNMPSTRARSGKFESGHIVKGRQASSKRREQRDNLSELNNSRW